jgi:hypothetical protein
MPPVGRKQVDYTDIRYDAITAQIDGITITFDPTKPNGIGKAPGTGDAVTLSANDTVALTQEGSYVYGKLLKVEPDGFCTVQKWGMATLPSSGTVTRGSKIVGAASGGNRGYIRSVNTAVAAELGVAKGDVINVADAPGAVVVDLG